MRFSLFFTFRQLQNCHKKLLVFKQYKLIFLNNDLMIIQKMIQPVTVSLT